MSERKNRIIRQLDFTEKMFGADGLTPKRRRAITEALASGKAAVTGAASSGASPESESTSSLDWDKLREAANVCRLCRLCETRTTVVFGEGNPKAELMFVGEAPGRDEDAEGRPFVGRAGQLLTKIIEAMGLKREDVYIANCLKCRPPENRPPLPDEVAPCRQYLLRQIDLIGPKVICALGKYGAQNLLETDVPISKLRGKFQEWRGTKVMPTYHPAYLLRNPGDKKLVWEDMQKIMAELGLKKINRES